VKNATRAGDGNVLGFGVYGDGGAQFGAEVAEFRLSLVARAR
jgi:hypothetical protein